MIKPIDINTQILKTGDIILQHTNLIRYNPLTWSGWFIRKTTKSKWNHSGEIFVLDSNMFVLESIGGGITLMPWSKFKKQEALVKVIRLKDFENKFNQKDYLIKGLMQLDKRYDYFGIGKIFIYLSTGYRVNPTSRASQSKRWCSEFNAWMKNIEGRQSYFPGDFDGNNEFETII